ncbi:hypothetical protein GYA19_02735 [Candidatus Beckwithbacteria bacterium]|nr:hypothetical protein [Candidatus Beckwithbacteria bacterium]
MKRIFPVIILLIIFLFSFICPVRAQDDQGNKLRDLENKIKEYQAKIEEAQGKQKTLASTIAVLNNQIYLTSAQITQNEEKILILEEEIRELGAKINTLNKTLDETSLILKERIEETYKKSFLPPLYYLLTTNDFSNAFLIFKYLKVAQQHDKEIMFSMEATKENFDKQKTLKEDKQKELEDLKIELNRQKNVLASQKVAKEDLLAATKNDEATFQKLLTQARSEYESIQAILAGRGDESKVGDVKKGDKIATIISGSSCNSSGTHLHFTVTDKNGNPMNPFSFLKNVDYENCSGPGKCSDGDPFNPSGSWDWPINPKITFVQGYGSTWAVANTWVGQIYSFHNGIDIKGSADNVYAVEDGVLYRGSYTGSGSCRLRYVRVEQKDDKQTFYLHVNY